MFDNLSDRLQGIFKKLSGQGRISETALNETLREVRLALLEADVHVSVVKELLSKVREKGLGAVEPTHAAELEWDREVNALADKTLFPRTDSWYTGSNIPGKPRHFSVHLGGAGYFHRIADVADKGYAGFVFEPERLADSVSE